MLAFPTKSISEVLDRFENLAFTCEYKYDGERAQVSLNFLVKIHRFIAFLMAPHVFTVVILKI
jgi:hypothetical protein